MDAHRNNLSAEGVIYVQEGHNMKPGMFCSGLMQAKSVPMWYAEGVNTPLCPYMQVLKHSLECQSSSVWTLSWNGQCWLSEREVSMNYYAKISKWSWST